MARSSSKGGSSKPQTVDERAANAVRNAQETGEITAINSVRGARPLDEGMVEVFQKNGKTIIMDARQGAGSRVSQRAYIRRNADENDKYQDSINPVDVILSRSPIAPPVRRVVYNVPALNPGFGQEPGSGYQEYIYDYPKSQPLTGQKVVRNVGDSRNLLRSFKALGLGKESNPSLDQFMDPAAFSGLDFSERVLATPNPSLSQESRFYGIPEGTIPYRVPEPKDKQGKVIPQRNVLKERIQPINTEPSFDALFPGREPSTLQEAAEAVTLRAALANPSNKGQYIVSPGLFNESQVERLKMGIEDIGGNPERFTQFTSKDGKNIMGLRKGIDPRALEFPQYRPAKENRYDSKYMIPGGGTAQLAGTVNIGGDGPARNRYSYIDNQGQTQYIESAEGFKKAPVIDSRGRVQQPPEIPRLNNRGFLEDYNDTRARLQRIGSGISPGQKAEDGRSVGRVTQRPPDESALYPGQPVESQDLNDTINVNIANADGDYGSRSVVDEMASISSNQFPRPPQPSTHFAKTLSVTNPRPQIIFKDSAGDTTALRRGTNLLPPVVGRTNQNPLVGLQRGIDPSVLGDQEVARRPVVGLVNPITGAVIGKTPLTGRVDVGGQTFNQAAYLGILSPPTSADSRRLQAEMFARNRLAIEQTAKDIGAVGELLPPGTGLTTITQQGDPRNPGRNITNLGAAAAGTGFKPESVIYQLGSDDGLTYDPSNRKGGNAIAFEGVDYDGSVIPGRVYQDELKKNIDFADNPDPAMADLNYDPVDLSRRFEEEGADFSTLDDEFGGFTGKQGLETYSQIASRDTDTAQGAVDEIYEQGSKLVDRKDIQKVTTDSRPNRGQTSSDVDVANDARQAQLLRTQGLSTYAPSGMLSSTRRKRVDSLPDEYGPQLPEGSLEGLNNYLARMQQANRPYTADDMVQASADDRYPQGLTRTKLQGPMAPEYGPQLQPGSIAATNMYLNRMRRRPYVNEETNLPDPNAPDALMGSAIARLVMNNERRKEVVAKQQQGVRGQDGRLPTPRLSEAGEYAVSQMVSVPDINKIREGRPPNETAAFFTRRDGTLKYAGEPKEDKTQARIAGGVGKIDYVQRIGEINPDIAGLFAGGNVVGFDTVSMDVPGGWNARLGKYNATDQTREQMPEVVSLNLDQTKNKGRGVDRGAYFRGKTVGDTAKEFIPTGSTVLARGSDVDGVEGAGEKLKLVNTYGNKQAIPTSRQMFNPLTRTVEVVPGLELTGNDMAGEIGDRKREAERQQRNLRTLTNKEWDEGRYYKDEYGRTMAPDYYKLGPDDRPLHQTFLEEDEASGLPARDTLYDFVKRVHGLSITGKRPFNMYGDDDPLAAIREYGEEKPKNKAFRAIPERLLLQGYTTQEQNDIYNKSKEIYDAYNQITDFEPVQQQAFTVQFADGSTKTVSANLDTRQIMDIQRALRDGEVPRLEPNYSNREPDAFDDITKLGGKLKAGELTQQEYDAILKQSLNDSAAVATVSPPRQERISIAEAALPTQAEMAATFPGIERVRTRAPQPSLLQTITGTRPDPQRQLTSGLVPVTREFNTTFSNRDNSYGRNFTQYEPGEEPMSGGGSQKGGRTRGQIRQENLDAIEADAAAREQAAKRKELEQRQEELKQAARYQQ